MQVTFLGTGSAHPTGRAQTGLLVREGPLLIDCGAGVLQNVTRSDVAFTDITHILFTHRHLDHMADFLPLVQALWLSGGSELAVYGPPGVQQTIDTWIEAFDYLDDALRLKVTKITPGETITVQDKQIRTLETRHGVQTLAYRIDDRFTFSADTEPMPELAEFAAGCDTLVHECSLPDTRIDNVSEHTTPSGLARILEGCDVDRVYLTHFYPAADDHRDEMLKTIEHRFSGNVMVATDMMDVHLDE